MSRESRERSRNYREPRKQEIFSKRNVAIMTICALLAFGLAFGGGFALREMRDNEEAIKVGAMRDVQIQQTATALAKDPDQINGEWPKSVARIWPFEIFAESENKSCTGTVIAVRPPHAVMLTIGHCVDEGVDALSLQTQQDENFVLGVILEKHTFDGSPNTKHDYATLLLLSIEGKDYETYLSLNSDVSLAAPIDGSPVSTCGFPGATFSGNLAARTDIVCQNTKLTGNSQGFSAMRPITIGSGQSGSPVVNNLGQIVCVVEGAPRLTTEPVGYCAPLPPDAQQEVNKLLNP